MNVLNCSFSHSVDFIKGDTLCSEPVLYYYVSEESDQDIKGNKKRLFIKETQLKNNRDNIQKQRFCIWFQLLPCGGWQKYL